MATPLLEGFFSPQSIAVIGASDTPGRIGYAVLRNLVAGGFKGRIYPVNPDQQKVNGLRAFPTLSRIDETVDLAVVASAAESVPGLIEEAGRVGVKRALVLSAGGKENGRDGHERNQHILQAARAGGLRIIGPDGVGIISAASSLNASFLDRMPPAGPIAFISQSGAMGLAILDRAAREHIGFRHFVSIGAMLDVDFGDLLNTFSGDREVRAIVLYVETLTQARKFMSAARAVSRIKPVIVLKAGRSRAEAPASPNSDTLADTDAIYRAAFARAGITQVETIEELFDCTELIAKQPLPAGPRLAVITNGGGPGTVALDALERMGLEAAHLSEETLRRLDAFLPVNWGRRNPIAIVGEGPPEHWRRAVEVCSADPGVDGLLVIFVPQVFSNAGIAAAAIIDFLNKKPKIPVFAVWMGGESVAPAAFQFNSQGIATYATPERAVAAFHRLHAHRTRQKMLQEIPGRFSAELTVDRTRARQWIDRMLAENRLALGEIDAKQVLAAYGIPVTPVKLARTAEEAVRLADQIGYPVVLKIVSPDIVRKSEVAGVCLALENSAAVAAAYRRLTAGARNLKPPAEVKGVSVQPMLCGADIELMLGSRRDPLFGPVVVFGTGGLYGEILTDRAIGLPPLNRALARQMIDATRIAVLLKGYRGRPAVSSEHLEEVLIRLSRLVADCPEIVALDINPAMVMGQRLRAVDARIRLAPCRETAPHHLVISPYPHHLEERTVTRDGMALLIRPIKPEDAPQFVDLFNRLSQESIYFRFFSPLKRIPPEMLAGFTQIDYDRDMAFVAMTASSAGDTMLGAVRLIRDPTLSQAEFSIMVADDLHGQGIGAALLRKLIVAAHGLGLQTLVGYVLADNKQMLALARKVGFRQRMNREMGAIELTIDVAMVITELPVTPNPAATATGPCLGPSDGRLEVRAVNEDNQP